ncbi:MAG: hypothetical protein HKN03_15095 [Acidimicrobiales bacterium]|nr:hypothetical protein [Acidimicrobiales bacterium]
MTPPPGETPRRSRETAGMLGAGPGVVEALAGEEVVVLLGSLEGTVLDVATDDGVVGAAVVGDAVLEDDELWVGESTVVEDWLVGSGAEEFGAREVGTGGPTPPAGVCGGSAGISVVVLSSELADEVVELSLKGSSSGSSPVTHPGSRMARTMTVNTRNRTHCHRQIGPPY